MNQFWFPTIVLYLAASACHADEITLDHWGKYTVLPSFQRCDTDSECTALEDICGNKQWHPLNKRYLSKAPFPDGAINCIIRDNPKPKLACVQQGCTAQKL